MDQTPEIPKGQPENIQKGTRFGIFPKPTEEETSMRQSRRLYEDGKIMGVLVAIADSNKPKEVANLPEDAWIISMRSRIDFTAELRERFSESIPGKTFKTLLATKENGQLQVSFGNQEVNTHEDIEQSARSIVYDKWIGIEDTSPETLQAARHESSQLKGDTPLTLTTKELSTTTFQFI